MQILDGIAVSPGIAIGEALVIDNEGFRIPEHRVERDAVDDEVKRLDNAIAVVAKEIERNRDAIALQLDDQYSAIFSAHLQMLRDPKLHREVEQLIRARRYTPEYAVSVTLRGYAKIFQESDDPYMAERAHDIFDLEKGLLRNLLGHRREELSQSGIFTLFKNGTLGLNSPS
nr:hypothetical protein [Planctomycetota bacterium]